MRRGERSAGLFLYTLGIGRCYGIDWCRCEVIERQRFPEMNNDTQADNVAASGSGEASGWPFDGAMGPFWQAPDAPESTRRPPADPLAQWVEQMCAGRVDALNKLYAAAEKPVRKLAFRITRDSALAEEVTQATFLKAWMQAGRYDPERGSVLTWLLCIAHSRSIDALREGSEVAPPHARPRTFGVDEADSQASPEDQAVESQRASELHRALAALDPLQRQLLGLAYFKGATQEEIAQRFQLPLGTVKSHIKRALAVLRRALEKALEADDHPKCLGRTVGPRAAVKQARKTSTRPCTQ